MHTVGSQSTQLMWARMLFDFHQKQNAKKPNSVHATYLVTGKKRSVAHTNGAHGKDGEDDAMRSSPFMSSMPEPEEPADQPAKETTIVLVREEELQGALYSGPMSNTRLLSAETRAEFDDESSIHIYSVEPGPIEV